MVGVDTTHGRVVAEQLTDRARVVFEGDYLREHVTLGYAGTVAFAQRMTIGRSNQYGICWSIMSDRASRAMAYVGMTRGRDEHHLAIYPAVTSEAHQHDTETGIHQMHRGTKHAAAHVGSPGGGSKWPGRRVIHRLWVDSMQYHRAEDVLMGFLHNRSGGRPQPESPGF